jgi:urea carboxylase-associated protein 2
MPGRPGTGLREGRIVIPTKEQLVEIDANRMRYEQLKVAGQAHAPRALPEPTARDGAPIADNAIFARETIPGGWYWTTQLKSGETIRIVNRSGTSCVSLQGWNSLDSSERLNHADTIKVQWAATLRKGRVILSDMGRVMFSIVEDTSFMHDTLTGGSTAATNAARYGQVPTRNTRDNFVLAAGKLGLDRRDVGPCISFFAPVNVDAAGRFAWNANGQNAGDFVDLRAEMDMLIALSNCPHPLDPVLVYDPQPVDVIGYAAGPVASDDLCRTASAEAVRAFENNATQSNRAAR